MFVRFILIEFRESSRCKNIGKQEPFLVVDKSQKKILTSEFFSKLYYCSQVWLTSSTISKLWKLVNSLHYRAVRIDFKGKINRENLDVLASRASPRQWSKYPISSMVINILRDSQPSNPHALISETIYEEQCRPGLGRFHDNSKGRIGKRKLGNNIQNMIAIQEPWLGNLIAVTIFAGSKIGPINHDVLERYLLPHDSGVNPKDSVR